MAKKPLELFQEPIFIESMKPMDFTKWMGQYALEIIYTNGDKQVLTTRSTMENVLDSGDFETLEELMAFYKDPRNSYKYIAQPENPLPEYHSDEFAQACHEFASKYGGSGIDGYGRVLLGFKGGVEWQMQQQLKQQ